MPRAFGDSFQALAGELPHGSHSTCTNVALRVSEELPGKLGYLRSKERFPEVSLSCISKDV